MRHTTDEAIMYDIVSAFASSPDVCATDIRVNMHNGKARLEGIVDSLAEKKAAEELARGIKGVKYVENDLVIGTDDTLSDYELTELVNTNLAEAQIPQIGARVGAGTVFLMGRASNTAMEEKAIEIAGSVSGIREVISELEIAAGRPLDDVSLANNVIEALSENPQVDAIGLHVTSEDGNVTVHGEVTNLDEIEASKHIASEVPGVKSVRCRIRITPPGF